MAYVGNNLTVQQYAPQIAYFSGNGSTTVFTLPIGVVTAAQILVVVANVPQNPSSSYSVSGTTLTFTSAPPSGTNNIWVEYTSLQTNLIQPANGTVGTAQLAGGTITTTADATINGVTVGKGGGSNQYSTVLGYQALYSSTNDNLAVGYQAAYSNTTGSSNTAVGHYRPLYLNTTGSYNTAIGREALYSNTTASNNTAVGYQAGYSNTTGTRLTAIGYQAGYANTVNNYSVYVGSYAGLAATGGSNTFVGDFAGAANTTGSANAFFGQGSGQAVTTGSNNTIVGGYNGNQGGLDIRTAGNYIVLSDGAGNPRGVFDNNGNLLVGTTSTTPTNGSVQINAGSVIASGYRTHNGISGSIWQNAFNIFWNGSAAELWIDTTKQGNIAYTSDYRIKRNIETQTVSGLDRITKLRPVTYQMADYGTLFKATDEVKEGFIAHEVQEVIPSGVEGEKDAENQIQSLRLDAILAVAIKAIQELNAKVDAQAAEIKALKGTA